MRKLHHISRFLRDNQGVAAIEFALAIPVLMTMFFGVFELNRYLLINQKADRIAYTVTDVVAQSNNVTTGQLDVVLNAATQIMLPFEFSNDGVVVISSVYKQDEDSEPETRWQYTGGGTIIRTSRIGNVNEDANLPGGLELNSRDNVIISEVYYRYTPIFGMGIVDAQDVYKTVIFKPRLGALTTPPT